jgi:mono/diheme cytochrome c family protein
MKPFVAPLALAASLVAVAAAVAQPAPPVPPPGPPMPTYQMRAKAPDVSRTAAGQNGAAQFSYRCGSCHLPFGMGSNLLTGQRVAMGETPDKGLLANRTDLTADYVQAVVRNGKGAMPPLSRVEVTDAELKAIAGFLGKGK